jgi:ketosteroid isomerase-like protein
VRGRPGKGATWTPCSASMRPTSNGIRLGFLTTRGRGFIGAMMGSRSSFANGWRRLASSAHAEEFIDAGDCVVVRVRQGAQGNRSGALVEMAPYWQVCRLRDAQAVRVEVYRDEADALEAVGLRE